MQPHDATCRKCARPLYWETVDWFDGARRVTCPDGEFHSPWAADTPVHRVVNHELRLFTVRLLREGNKWGLAGALTHEGKPVVEFYDATYAHDPRFIRQCADYAPLGQFVARYRLAEIMALTGGLRLDAGVPVWFLDAAAVEEAQEWVKAVLHAV